MGGGVVALRTSWGMRGAESLVIGTVASDHYLFVLVPACFQHCASASAVAGVTWAWSGACPWLTSDSQWLWSLDTGP